MTCIIAYREDGIGYMCGDFLGSNSHVKVERKDDKVFEKDGMLFGFTSSYRMGQIIRYCFDAPVAEPKMTDHAYLVKLFVPELIKIYEANSYLMKGAKGDATGGTFLIIRNGKIFEIENDFQVAEYKHDFWSCGSGSQVAYGAMRGLSYNYEMTPEQKLRKSIEIVSEHITSVGKTCKIINKDFT